MEEVSVLDKKPWRLVRWKAEGGRRKGLEEPLYVGRDSDAQMDIERAFSCKERYFNP